jgi:hypothetical protein
MRSTTTTPDPEHEVAAPPERILPTTMPVPERVMPVMAPVGDDEEPEAPPKKRAAKDGED